LRKIPKYDVQIVQSSEDAQTIVDSPFSFDQVVDFDSARNESGRGRIVDVVVELERTFFIV
jgi:hypothetical protein